MFPAVNKPLKFEGVYQLSSVYNPFPFENRKWSHSAFLIAFLVQKLKTYKDCHYLHSLCITILFAFFMCHGLICVIYVSRSYLHSLCHDLICILFHKPHPAQLLRYPDFSTKEKNYLK